MIKVSINGSGSKMLAKAYKDTLKDWKTEYGGIYEKYYKTPFSWVHSITAVASVILLAWVPATIFSTICVGAGFDSFSTMLIVALLSILIAFLTFCVIFHFKDRKPFLETWGAMMAMDQNQYCNYVKEHPEDVPSKWEEAHSTLDNMTMLINANRILDITKQGYSSIDVAYTDEDDIVCHVSFYNANIVEKVSQEDTMLTLKIDEHGDYYLVLTVPYNAARGVI